MKNSKSNIALHHHVIKTLLYYDIFNYPLKSSEVFRFLGINSITETDVVYALNKLKEENILFQ
ncbi:MAG: hypothetical protein C0490_18755, partial [Marivirga sp.]|nr:hypothetical protein [Marivirga sp.]